MADRPDELGAELHRLATSLQDWAKRAVPDVAGGVECLPWCPICQFAHVLRGEHPEVAERLTEAGTAIASAIKALADATVTRAQPGKADRPRPTPRVQHIRLDEPS
jgi:hypothetical protein